MMNTMHEITSLLNHAFSEAVFLFLCFKSALPLIKTWRSTERRVGGFKGVVEGSRGWAIGLATASPKVSTLMPSKMCLLQERLG